MRKFALVLALGMLSTAANAADYRIDIINQSAYTVYRLFATNHGNRSWGDDILPNTIPPGYHQVIDVNDDSGRCVFDLRAEGEDGTVWTKYGINACTITSWTLND